MLAFVVMICIHSFLFDFRNSPAFIEKKLFWIIDSRQVQDNTHSHFTKVRHGDRKHAKQRCSIIKLFIDLWKKIFEFNLYEHAQVIYTERKSSPLINDDVCRKI